MSLRLFLHLSLLFAAATIVRGAELPAVNYTLRFPDAVHHYVEVEADLPTDGAADLDLFMPVWTPGSYLIREYARNLDRIAATAPDGSPLAIEKTAKNRWRVTTRGHDRVLVKYRVYGWEINVRTDWIERDFAMLNGAPTYLTVANDFQHRPYHVQVALPAGWAGVYTPLTPGDQPHAYTAPDFDTLIDSPLLAGSPQVDKVEIDGVPHFLVTIGGDGVWDNARAARNLAQLLQTEKNFWGKLPFHQPYYIFNLLTGDRGGLEHKQALVMVADRWLSRTRGGINSWLSLVSHEYFHAWNGKRLRPIELGPFPYEHEAYTKSLWVVEGITSYYQHIMMRRAGFYTREDYLGSASGLIAGIERIPGRMVQSLSDSSFDAWIKGYRPDENSVNTRFSYYSGGSVAALLLDAEVRRASAGAKSLDDVMRAAFARYSGPTGYTPAQFTAVASEVAGVDLAPWFHRFIDTPGRFDYQPMLDWYGLQFKQPQPASTTMLPNGLEPPDPASGWLGADTKTVDGRIVISSLREGTPAYASGLDVNDELVAINGFRVTGSPETLVKAYHAGDKVTLLASRLGHLVTLTATLGHEPQPTWQLEVRPDATAAQKAHLEAWIGSADSKLADPKPAETAPTEEPLAGA